MSLPKELELVYEAFERNARVNRAVLATLDMGDLDYGDGVGGFSIGQHLADIVGFRRDWLSRVSPEHAERLLDITDADAPNRLKAGSIGELQAAFDDGDAAIRDAVLDAVRDGRRFDRAYASHPAQLMVHCVVHDAHHRGQILALLRQSGRAPEERERLEDATWPIWRV
ncbi:MAG: damage-inducible protein DinB [bacterium]|nr:damage-inducible protein DinB [bacterium]